MVPLIVLITTFVLLTLARWRRPDHHRSERLALALMLLVTAVAHFTKTAALVAMLPRELPLREPLVWLSGFVEMGFAAARVWRPSEKLGWALALMLLVMLPVNVFSALTRVGLGGHGAAYLWFRVPLQVLFIGWALLSTRAATASWLILWRRSTSA